MQKFGRNDLCWCGSGKKFKKCHYGREDQKKATIWDMQPRFLDIYKAKTCFHPQASDASCSRGIIRAHTVRRSADLKMIARDGHVYQGQIDAVSIKKHGLRIVPRLVGVKEASTFFGFCHLHDCSTFAPVETSELVPTDAQAFLLAYRPLVKGFYLKMRQLEVNELSRQLDKGRSVCNQYRIQQFVGDQRIGIESAIRELEHHKSIFDADLVENYFGNIRYVAIHFDGLPHLVCSCLVQPVYTFDGLEIQSLSDIESPLEQIAFSLLSTHEGGVAIFSWHNSSNEKSSALVDSLLALPEAGIPAALVRFALSESENVFISPNWWEGLDARMRGSLESRMNHNVNPFIEMDKDILREDGLRPVDWHVRRIGQKRS